MPSLWQHVLWTLCAVVGCVTLSASVQAQVPVRKIQVGPARKLQIIPAPAPQAISAISAASDIYLLRLDYVRDELDLTAEQCQKLDELFRQYDEKSRQGWEAIRDVPPQERVKKSAEIRQQSAQRLEDLRKQAGDVLLPHQQEKLEQVVFRIRAQSALANPRLIDQLGLDDQQKQLLQQLREELAAKTRQLQREMAEKSLDVLTPEQRQQLKDIYAR